MKLEIITPEKEYFSGEVEYVEIPGVEGHMGLLPGHAPLVTMLNDEPDEDLRYKVDKNSKEIELALGPGYMEIAQDKISVLTDWIVSEEDDIDVDAAEEAMQRAKDALENVTEEDEKYDALQATIARSLAQISVKNRRKNL
ncbi:MAG: ATP synthase F1 subunit epsilon [Verrucomicrobiota bacterium]|nr:ATP synthase F1 subunit epsilon [Verrucomicrobiota bacterium]MEC9328188.1 ATP synthase F1 subunit epsilon [Verrucomicrobiota bacterium]MED6298866.1 ATP synthase F1 subunit epsilon [Verrucomicrobiota bacterium]